MRQGVGKVRHLQVKHLWLQESVAAGGLTRVMIPRVENCSDALTHPWGAHDLPFWEAMGICLIPAKADISSSPMRARDQSTYPSVDAPW